MGRAQIMARKRAYKEKKKREEELKRKRAGEEIEAYEKKLREREERDKAYHQWCLDFLEGKAPECEVFTHVLDRLSTREVG